MEKPPVTSVDVGERIVQRIFNAISTSLDIPTIALKALMNLLLYCSYTWLT